LIGPNTECWLLVVGCWLLVVGCWLLVVGCWFLFILDNNFIKGEIIEKDHRIGGRILSHKMGTRNIELGTEDDMDLTERLLCHDSSKIFMGLTGLGSDGYLIKSENDLMTQGICGNQ
jgi:hypothetical protein